MNKPNEKKLNKGTKQNDIKPANKRRIRTELLPKPVLLRIDEVAHYFDVTERTVYLWIEHGHLETAKTPGGQIRVTKESMEKCRLVKR